MKASVLRCKGMESQEKQDALYFFWLIETSTRNPFSYALLIGDPIYSHLESNNFSKTVLPVDTDHVAHISLQVYTAQHHSCTIRHP